MLSRYTKKRSCIASAEKQGVYVLPPLWYYHSSYANPGSGKPQKEDYSCVDRASGYFTVSMWHDISVLGVYDCQFVQGDLYSSF